MTSPDAGWAGPDHAVPPSDPWLAAVTTSTLSGEPVGVAPSAVAWPAAHFVADDPAPVPADPVPADPAPAPANRRWLLVLLAVVVVLAGLGFLAFHRPSGGDRPHAATVPTSRPPSAAPAVADQSLGMLVTYEVTAGRSHNAGSVQYTDRDGDIIQRGGVPLPWRLSFPITGHGHPLVLIAQRTSGADTGPVTCTITAGGKVLSQVTQTGRYAAPECSAAP